MYLKFKKNDFIIYFRGKFPSDEEVDFIWLFIIQTCRLSDQNSQYISSLYFPYLAIAEINDCILKDKNNKIRIIELVHLGNLKTITGQSFLLWLSVLSDAMI